MKKLVDTEKDDYLCVDNGCDEITFNGHPVTMDLIDDEVYITCKGVVGTLSQAKEYIENKKHGKFYFGEARIRNYPDKKVKIDCLIDDYSKILQIYKQAKQLKNVE